jgi:hypothetical protein
MHPWTLIKRWRVWNRNVDDGKKMDDGLNGGYRNDVSINHMPAVTLGDDGCSKRLGWWMMQW